MRHILLTFLLVIAALLAVTGLRGCASRRPPIELFADMVRQPRQRPQSPSDVFPDARGSRAHPEGTVAQGEPWQDLPLYTGRQPDLTNLVETNPLPITPALLARGQERFTINCRPCHGAQADGNGVTRKIAAMGVVANLHDPRIVAMPDGELFQTVAQGKNLMGSYAGQITSADRWAIIAYLRALQLSKLGLMEDVPAEMRSKIK
jgi:mono/diheme cytochrome c family protein